MPATITGNPASATQSTAPTASVPSDGDALSSSSVSGPFQTLLHNIAKLWTGIFAGQTAASPGLDGTGGATAPGVAATAGGGGTPARGALALTPQAAPSAPSNGDVWIETGSNTIKARVAGATQTLTPATGTAPVAITPNAGWTALQGLAYLKDLSGVVRLKGRLGGPGGNPAFTLPAGFRPASLRFYSSCDGAGVLTFVSVDTTGAVACTNSAGAAASPSYVDAVSFLAEQ